jgi:hypothetical protein
MEETLYQRKTYRGITTSVLAKVLEIALLQRITPILDVADIPQISQTAYRKGVSCQDCIFAGIKANTRFVIEKEKVYTCFYDLASAFELYSSLWGYYNTKLLTFDFCIGTPLP